MAGDSRLVDLQQDRVAVAVEFHFKDMLNVAAFVSLTPATVPTAAEVNRSSRLQCFLVGSLVHPSKHQHFARCGILSDSGKEPASFVEIGLVGADHAHGGDLRVGRDRSNRPDPRRRSAKVGVRSTD